MQPAQDGEKGGLVYRVWEPSLSKAVFVLIHGLGAHSARWEPLAEYFLMRDISSCAIDLKGFGLTRDLRGHIDSFEIYFDDIAKLVALVKKEHPRKKVFCCGESMGALLLFLLGQKKPDLCDGLMFISPAFATKFKLTFGDYARVFGALLYDPKKTFDLPLTSALCTRDIFFQNKIDTDERESRRATSRLLTHIVFAQIAAYFSMKSFKAPILFLLPGDDRIIDSKASKAIFSAIKAKDKELIEYGHMYHALSIDKDKEKVFGDILKWVLKRI